MSASGRSEWRERHRSPGGCHARPSPPPASSWPQVAQPTWRAQPQRRPHHQRQRQGSPGPRFGCGLAECGACTVHLDGAAVRSCVTRVGDIGSRQVTTPWGPGNPEQPSSPAEDPHGSAGGPVQLPHQWWWAPLPSRSPTSSPPTRRSRDARAGNPCRCGGHCRIPRAIKTVIGA